MYNLIATLCVLVTGGSLNGQDLPMRSGGISLLQSEAKIDANSRPLLVHVYTVPKGPVAEPGRPVTRERITHGTSLETSPFYLDLFSREGGKLHRVNSARFEEDGDVVSLEVRWLRPKERKGPVILLRFGVGDEGEWFIFAFPHGLQQPAVVQRLGFSFSEDESCLCRFDEVDRHGQMVICEDCDEGGKHSHHVYPWDGRRFRGLKH